MPASRRRRGCLLENAGPGREDRVQSRGHGLASLSQDGAGILETTDGLRQSRGHAREKVAGKVQFRWLRNVGRTHLCERHIPLAFVVSRANLSGNVGNGRVCATVPACTELSELTAAHARVAADESCVGCALWH